ncbi:MAG: N-acetylmuramoyl-L-alanine amidase [Proteobacteria bacterium]|jgi:hypothetical protein|nr:N-acetylmuramoyl-L-alanine amidase [Pseudomonadota bacterium]
MNIQNIISQLPRKGTQDSAHSIGSITHIIVHHDAEWRPEAYDDLTRYRSQANFHIGRGEDGLQYHYKISNMGDVYQCRNLADTLWHCGNYPINRASIAICLDGNFEEQQPTAQQIQALSDLLDELCTRHPEFPADKNTVFGHREVGASACPGRNLIGLVQKYRAVGTMGAVVVAPNPPVVQDPPKPQFFKVYAFNGEQVGAFTTQDNAQKKLDTMEAGTIKNPAGVIIITKEKKPPVVVPPFKDDTTPKPPTEPPVDVIPPVVVVPPKEEPKVDSAPSDEVSQDVLKGFLMGIWELLKVIGNFINVFKRKG